MSRSNSSRRKGGFSLLEVVIAMAILVIGVSAMAALSATILTRGRQSKYMSLAGTLASEKLEDLNRWQGTYAYDTATSQFDIDASDPQICVQSSDTQEGSLPPVPMPVGFTGTVSTITCNGSAPATVRYYDDVSIDLTNSTDCPNPADGCFAETVSNPTDGSYLTTYHSPDGTIPNGGAATPVKASVAPSANLTFHRNWVIEANPVINGVQVNGMRRITVMVNLTDYSSYAKNAVSFQMSVVRP